MRGVDRSGFSVGVASHLRGQFGERLRWCDSSQLKHVTPLERIEIMVGLTFPRSVRESQALGGRSATVIRTPAKALPTHDEIAARAYEIYVRNGRREGASE